MWVTFANELKAVAKAAAMLYFAQQAHLDSGVSARFLHSNSSVQPSQLEQMILLWKQEQFGGESSAHYDTSYSAELTGL